MNIEKWMASSFVCNLWLTVNMNFICQHILAWSLNKFCLFIINCFGHSIHCSCLDSVLHTDFFFFFKDMVKSEHCNQRIEKPGEIKFRFLKEKDLRSNKCSFLHNLCILVWKVWIFMAFTPENTSSTNK